MDLEHLRSWVGRSREASDMLTPRLLEAYRATLAPHLAPTSADEAPPALHWCLAPEAVPAPGLGHDGHPLTGDFLPPVPLPRRMWAGGELETLGVLRVGDRVVRRSRIADVAQKSGRSGTLCFVTVEHEISTDRGVAIREHQDLVYRDAPPARNGVRQSPTETPAATTRPPDCEDCWTVQTSPVLLFRYSALTFNGHRIHYDRPYATGMEGYAGLVVHGPLQASLLLNLAATIGGQTPRRFTYRGMAPLIAESDFRACGQRLPDGSMRCCTRSAAGEICMEASASW